MKTARILNALVASMGIFIAVISFQGIAEDFSSASSLQRRVGRDSEIGILLREKENQTRQKWKRCLYASGIVVLICCLTDCSLVRSERRKEQNFRNGKSA